VALNLVEVRTDFRRRFIKPNSNQKKAVRREGEQPFFFGSRMRPVALGSTAGCLRLRVLASVSEQPERVESYRLS